LNPGQKATRQKASKLIFMRDSM